jgi:serine/threonine protein kinase
MTCQKCGSAVREDVKFCGNCGAPIGLPEGSDPRILAYEKALNFKYRILKKIGVGGFAEVYLGEHTQLGRKVAIKFLRHGFAGEEEMIERFRRESKSAAKLSHPNIIDIYDVGENEGLYYFVMKYVEGETLGKKMQRERKVQPAEAIHIIKQVADALSYAHDHEVIHRDIKPANVMLDQYKKPVLMDFGIARVQFEGNLTKTGTLMGTPHYLPPEQPLGRPVDGRSDIYSLGIMFYEMLAGKPPFHDENSVTLIFKHINEPPPSLLENNPELAPELCAVVHKMIEKLPENRYQSAGDVVEALEALGDVYPVLTPTGRSRSTGGSRNTEQLLQLAKENLELQKFDKAIEIYATVVKRDPENSIAKKAVADLSSILGDRLNRHLAEHQFPEAKLVFTQLSKLPIPAEQVAAMRASMESAEQNFAKLSEFQDHLNAAKVAMEHDNATGAIDRLTKALIVDPSSTEAQTMLKSARAKYESNRQKAEFANAYSEAEYYFDKSSYDQAQIAIRKALEIDNDPKAVEMNDRIQAALKEKAYKQAEQERILTQVDQLCEQLDFEGALLVLESARSELPVFVESKIEVVQRNRNQLNLLQQARLNFQNRRWAEASHGFSQFLESAPPYDFQVFYGLRKEAEELLRASEQELGQPRSPEAEQLKKADVMIRMGQYEEALQECKRIQKSFPGNAAVVAKIAEIEEILHPGTRIAEKIPRKPAPAAPNPEIPDDYSKQTMQVPVPSSRIPTAPPPPAARPEPRISTPQAPAPAARPAAQAVHSQAPARPQPRPEIAEVKGSQMPLILGGAGVALVIIIGALFFLLSDSDDKPKTDPQRQTQQQNTTKTKQVTPATQTAVPVAIDVQPWATFVVSGENLKSTLTDQTPAVISLPPGRYTIVFENPALPSFTETIEVTSSNQRFTFAFKQFDVDKIADSVMH